MAVTYAKFFKMYIYKTLKHLIDKTIKNTKKLKMLVTRVSLLNHESHVSPTSVGRRRRRKMVENHVSPTSVWQEEVKNG